MFSKITSVSKLIFSGLLGIFFFRTWGTYDGDFYAGTPAIVSHKLGKGTVTYVGVDSKTGDLEKQVLTKAFNQRGIPIENYPPGIMVEYRDGFGIAVNYSDQVYEMNLPATAKILIGTKAVKTADVPYL